MATAKRLYLYLVSAVGLGMLIAGVAEMLRLLLVRLGVGPQQIASTAASNADKEALAIGISVGVVGLALWAAHWSLAERMVSGSSDQAIAERRSIVRSVYLSLWSYGSLIASGVLFANTMSNALGDLVSSNRSPVRYTDDATSLALVVPLALTWAYSAWVRARDVRQGPVIAGAASWVSRLYLYLAALYAVEQIFGGLGGFLSFLVLGVFGSAGGMTGAQYLRELVVLGAVLLVWVPILAGHWLYSVRLCAGTTEQSLAERVSRVRVAFFMLVILDAVIVFATDVSSGLGSLIVRTFDLRPGDPVSAWYEVLGPIAVAAPWLLAWYWSRRRAFLEAPAGPAGVSAHRVSDYLTGFVGIVALAIGLAEAVSTFLDQLLSNTASNLGGFPGAASPWKITVVTGFAIAVVGLAIWAVGWIPARRRRRVDWPNETASSSRAWYLYLVSGAAMVWLAASAALVLLPMLRRAFGLEVLDLGDSVALPLGFVFVATGLAATHLWTLRNDALPPAPVWHPAFSPAGTGWPGPGQPGYWAAPGQQPAPQPGWPQDYTTWHPQPSPESVAEPAAPAPEPVPGNDEPMAAKAPEESGPPPYPTAETGPYPADEAGA
jgi:hypothetical protein